MSAIDVFTYSTDQQVRAVVIDGEPWFVAADVARILGYSATAAMTRSLDDDEKGVQILHTPGGEQEFTVISEPGLYEAILRSRVPNAASFKRWLKHDVLPTIRRTGSYAGAAQLPQTYAEALRAAADAWEAKELADAALALAAPKVEAFDAFMSADGTYTMEAAAKSLYDATGLGRNKLYGWLRQIKVLMSTNTPYQKYIDAGWFEVIVGSHDQNGIEIRHQTTKVTPKGIDGIRRLWMAQLGGAA